MKRPEDSLLMTFEALGSPFVYIALFFILTLVGVDIFFPSHLIIAALSVFVVILVVIMASVYKSSECLHRINSLMIGNKYQNKEIVAELEKIHSRMDHIARLFLGIS